VIVPPLDAHLTYCTNIHPGESWAEVSRNLRTFVPHVKARVSPNAPFGLGLRLSARAAEELESGDELARFRELLAAEGLYVFTLNGFPYGRFHGGSVKEAVYLPDWRDDARVVYTDRLATLLSELLPAGVSGSVSTVPGGFKPRVRTAAEVSAVVTNLVRHAAHLHGIAQRRGQVIRLALEPEPACMLETIAETVSFFHEHVFGRAACRELGTLLGASSAEAERILRTHVGVCLDACHMAVEFEDPHEAVAALARAGITVAKVQVTAGLAVPFGAAAHASLGALEAFAEETYLHQVVEKRGSTLVRWVDLPDALASARTRPPREGEEWRVHFHVPVFHEDLGAFVSTQAYVRELLTAVRARGLEGAHLEVETYTWDVLPAAHRPGSVVDGIAREIAWVKEELS